ncbi:hypothetical protein RB195_000152 [Necator americanus]|uniref:phospholipase A2 n=1 Tax=Necator americanus TaxID=51031 RepID=A0ABR1D872_NECAM
MFKSLRELVTNPSREGILSAARNAVAEFTHRQEGPQPQKIIKLSPSRFEKMLKLDNLKNVSCHSETVDGTAVFHSVYIAGHLSLTNSNDEKEIRILCSKLDILINSVEAGRDRNLVFLEDGSKLITTINLLALSKSKTLSGDCFTSLMNVVSSEPEWEAIHYAAACGFLGFLKTALEKDRQVVLGFATQDGDFPIHIAAKWGQVEAVRVLLENGADLCQRDAMGRTVVHWAAANSASALKDLSNETSFGKAVTVQDEHGLTPLALAIRNANFESTKILMESAATAIPAGSYPLLTVLMGLEYSEALGNCLELVITIHPSVVEQVDESGKSVLHLQLSKKVLMKILKHSIGNININLKDADGQTPLHLAVNRGDVGSAVALLSYGADVNCSDKKGVTALMKAVQVGHLDLVKLLLLFDADLSAMNATGESIHDISKSSRRRADVESILAVMDPPQTSPSPAQAKSPWDHLQDAAIHAQKESKDELGTRINLLSLDGGGIRGLVVIQMLAEIEKKFGTDLLSAFGWLGGTSTGAILALALSQGKSIAHCRSMYFRLKHCLRRLTDYGRIGGQSSLLRRTSVCFWASRLMASVDELFCGDRPYSGTNLDSFLRSEFGETTTLADITSKKVMVTTCLANVCPPQLKLLRNYQLQISDVENTHMGFNLPKNVLLREAALCSSAAPTYFPPFDKKYVDGGLLANNPCPQLLTDVQLMNASLKMTGKPEQCYRIGCVVSLGTGRVPEAAVESLDLTVPKSFVDFALDFQNKLSLISHLKNLLLDQIGRADGTVVESSRAWSSCISAPFFRYSPKLSFAVELDETDDIKLINIMWGAKVYMNEESASVGQLVDLLKTCTS